MTWNGARRLVLAALATLAFEVTPPLFAASGGRSTTTRWSIHPLMSLGGKYSSAESINRHGQIAGWSDTADGVTHAVLWLNALSRPIDLGTLGGARSVALAVNDSGQVVGTSETLRTRNGRSIKHAFLWQNGRMIDLDPRRAADDFAAINDRGQVLVSLYAAQSLLWQNGHTTNIPLFVDSAAQFNNRGEVVGGLNPGYIWRNGHVQNLGRLEGNDANPYAINNDGTIVGIAGRFGFIWRNGRLTSLGQGVSVLHDRYAWPLYINDHGVAVGSCLTSDRYHDRPCMWRDGRAVPIGGPTARGVATMINKRGQIIGGYRRAAFESKGADLHWLPGLRSHDCVAANSINDQVVIVGVSGADCGHAHAVIWIEREVA